MRRLFPFLFLVSTLAVGATPIEEHCDVGAANLRDLPTKTAEECRTACDEDSACAAFTHISGWNRCFLKKAAKPKTTVKMHSGFIETKDGVRRVVEEGEALDHNGKDWQKHLTDSPETCKDLCLKAPPCEAFTLIGGYRTCWLKKTAGKLRPKVFRCGVKAGG